MKARLDLTAGQVWTLSLGLVLGVLLLGASVPAVLEQRGLVAPAAAQVPPPVAVPPPAGGLASGLLPPADPPAPAPLPEPAPLPVAPAPLAFDLPPGPALPAAEQAPAPAPSPAAPAPPAVFAPAPLRVVEAGYTSSAAEPGLPEGGLPVSARLGERVSTVHVRLSGDTGVLVLPLSGATGAQVQPEQARVRACRITTTGWEPERPGPGVPFDVDDCVDGTVSARDVRFDLGVFPERAGRAGFALVADLRGSTATSPRTFRLTLDPEDN